MPLRWQSKLRLMHPGPANGRLPARSGQLKMANFGKKQSFAATKLHSCGQLAADA